MNTTYLLQSMTGTEATLFIGWKGVMTLIVIGIIILYAYQKSKLPVLRFHQLQAGMPVVIVKAKPGKHPIAQTLANFEEIKEKPYTGNRRLFKIHKTEVATYSTMMQGRKYEVVERDGGKILEDSGVIIPIVETLRVTRSHYTD